MVDFLSVFRPERKKDADEIFRKEALERLSSPERLDELMQIISPRSWLSLLTFACLVGAALVWTVFGRLPTTVSGQGVLIRPRQVVAFQSPASGSLIELLVQTGDVVKTADVLGRIDQAEIRQQLQEERAKLAALQFQDQEISSIQLQQGALQIQQVELEKSAIELQKRDISKRLRDAKALIPVLKQRVENQTRLEELGLAPKKADELLQAQERYLENQDKTAGLDTELKQLESELKQLDGRLQSLSLDTLESSTSRENQIQELQSNIALFELQLESNSQIISKHSGRVVEVAVNLGQRVVQGDRLGSINTSDNSSELVGLTYFSVKDGKKIQPGMKIQIVPETVKRERFGGIVGVVTSVSAFPVSLEGVQSLVGNAEVAKRLTSSEPQIEVSAALEKDETTYSGYRWSSSRGPELVTSSGTTATARVVVEQRAPITYILPSLREIIGL